MKTNTLNKQNTADVSMVVLNYNTSDILGDALESIINSNGSLQLYYRRTLTPVLFFFTTLFGRFIDKYLLKLLLVKSSQSLSVTLPLPYTQRWRDKIAKTSYNIGNT